MFARVSIVKGDQSAVGVAAYIARANWTCDRLRKRHQHRRKRDDLVSVELFLPDGSPLEFRDPERFWNAVEAREYVTDKKTKQTRLRKDAQLAKHMILALPHELGDGERDALLRDFVNGHLVSHGIGVLAAIHRPDDAQGLNWHAHLLITTRPIDPAGHGGFGKKARHLNLHMSRGKGKKWSKVHPDDLPGQWRRFQNDWFQRQGLPYFVRPASDSPGRHRGRRARVNPEAVEAEEAQRASEAKWRLQDIEQFLTRVTRDQSTFTEEDLLSLLRDRGYDAAEATRLARLALDQPGTKRLYDPQSLERSGSYTWRLAWDKERHILDIARELHDSRQSQSACKAAGNQVIKTAKKLGLDLGAIEQDAARRAIYGPRLTLLPGVLHINRSPTIKVIRSLLENRGFRVIGLAPTRAAATDVRGSAAAPLVRSWQQELAYQTANRPGRPTWNEKTCVIVEEANLLDADTLVRLLDLAKNKGARLILAGDEAGSRAAGRSGMFQVLRRELGYPVPRDLRHLRSDWAQAVDRELGAGRVADAINIYASEGRIQWHPTREATQDALVLSWKQSIKREGAEDHFIFTGSKDAADAINRSCQKARWRGKDRRTAQLPTAYGELRLHQYDRIQFHADYPDRGITAGMRATAYGLKGHALRIRTDDGRDLIIDYREVRNWGLGYAGTVLGTTGVPVNKAYILYDDPDIWSADLLHAALARHRGDVNLYVPMDRTKDKAALAQQMSAVHPASPAHAWLIREDVLAIQEETARFRLDFFLDGAMRTLDLRLPSHRQTARRAFNLLPVADAAALYSRVVEIGRVPRAPTAVASGIQSLKLQLDISANTGGFQPTTGKPAPWCIQQHLQHTTTLPVADDFRLELQDGHIDIRGLLHDPLQVSPKDRQGLFDALYRFRPPVLEAASTTITDMMGNFKAGTGLWYLLHYANIVTKRLRAIAPRDENGKRRSLDEKLDALHLVADQDACRRITGEFDYRASLSNAEMEDPARPPVSPSISAALTRQSETRLQRRKRLEQEAVQLERQLPQASALDKINLLLDLRQVRLELAPIHETEDNAILAATRTAIVPVTPPQFLPAFVAPSPPSLPPSKSQRLARCKADLQRQEKELRASTGSERVELIADIQGLRMLIDLLTGEIAAEQKTNSTAGRQVATAPAPTPASAEPKITEVKPKATSEGPVLGKMVDRLRLSR